MDKPKTPYEQASQELNEFRERRVAERRSRPRGTPDRRRSQPNEIRQSDKHSPRKDLH
ncbi:hypothetical protein [Oxalobacter paraformigenes]|uniref:hypothetical protein n=1 Tax=Oxalobacter paraformigenes TaxID=556268 RepID=UPI0002FC40FD|nr:hypothetical protein [Oxalobacter paraformigenes]